MTMLLLYTDRSTLATAVIAAVSPTLVTVERQPAGRDYPRRPQWLVTTAALSVKAQREAAAVGAQGVIVLPQGGDWLAAKVKAGRITVLAGYPPHKNAGLL